MRLALFYHSLVSDWNHGNAHFLRGVAGELLARGHSVEIYEPADAWSAENLVREHGSAAIADFHCAYPTLRSHRYDALDLDAVLAEVDGVIVHEWNDPSLVERIGEHRARGGAYRLLFHDTHHRAVTERGNLVRYDLRRYDGVLAYGRVLRDLYLCERWTPTLAREIAEHGRQTILARHTCGHRVEELLGIFEELGCGPKRRIAAAAIAAR